VPGVSTPRRLRLPALARAYPIATARGDLAVHDARPPAGVRPLGTAVLVPGFTGSKEDFTAILEPLAARGWRVVALDMPGQYESAGPADVAAYDLEELGRDVLAVAAALGDGRVHVVGHSFGGLVARSAAVEGRDVLGSVTLLCSGPAAVSGEYAQQARLAHATLEELELTDIWAIIERMDEASHAALPAEIREFVRRRFLSNAKAGLLGMVRQLLTAPDRTDELRASGVPVLVAYGEADYVWSPAEQAAMADRLGAAHEVIRDAAHSPAVEQPEATSAVLDAFWRRVIGR
jgi:pimeloyl-ACP methyl ester carboxylesterase